MLSTAMICAAAYVLGILLTQFIAAESIVLFSICVIFSFLIVSVIFKHRNYIILLSAVLLTVGAVRADARFVNCVYDELGEKYVTVFGTVISTPSRAHGVYPNRFVIQSDKIVYLDNTYKTDCKLLINAKEQPEAGEQVIVTGFLMKTAQTGNEFEYDFSDYYKSIGIYGRISAREFKSLGVRRSFDISMITKRVQQKIYRTIINNYESDDAAILCAVLLGDNSYFKQDYKNLLSQTGVLHTLYSAFIHVLLIFFAAGIFFSRDRKKYDFCVMLLLSLYAVLNASSPISVKNAFLLIFVILIKNLCGYSDRAEVLSVIVLIMTVLDPMLCFNSGFVMSVASTVSIYLLYPVIYERVQALSIAQRKLFKPVYIFSLWAALTLGTLPLAAYYFNAISLYSLLFAPLLMPCIFILLMLSPLFAFGIKLPLNIVLMPIKILPYIIRKLPFYHIMLRNPSLLEIITYYFIIWLIIRILKYGVREFKTRSVAAGACILIIICIALSDFNTLSIYFVNVGQGDAAVLHTSRGETVLIDGGGNSEYNDSYNIGESVFLPYLISHGFTHIDVAVLSHCHKDHAEGIIAAMENLEVDTVVMPPALEGNEYRTKIEQIAAEKGIRLEYLAKSDEIRFGSGLNLNILAPYSDVLNGLDENNTSIVAKVTYGDFTALFTGDSGLDVTSDYPKDVQLLKVAHHGSKSASGEEFINYVNPRYAVISVGKNNSYNLPDREVTDRLKRHGACVLRTDELGDIRFKVRKNGKITYNSYFGG